MPDSFSRFEQRSTAVHANASLGLTSALSTRYDAPSNSTVSTDTYKISSSSKSSLSNELSNSLT